MFCKNINLKNKIHEQHTYFRTLRTVNPHYADCIDQNALETFISSISKFYAHSLRVGFAQVDPTTIELKESTVKDYFVTGFTCIQNGMEPLAIETIMEYLILASHTQELTYQELFEMKFIEKIIPLMQHCEINEYTSFIAQFSSTNRCQIQEEFKGLIP